MAQPPVPVITIDGQYFYKEDQRFIARGAVYRPNGFSDGSGRIHPGGRRGLDPLQDADYERLRQDVVALKELNINALWVYHHIPSEKHDRCMALLAMNGIYVIFEASDLRISMHRGLPIESYDKWLLGRYAEVIDSVSKYNNTLGVCIANKLITNTTFSTIQSAQDSWTALGLVVKQMKQYMRFKNYDTGQRILPLCISDGQWSSLNTTTYQYIAGSKADFGPIRPAGGRVDFYCFAHYDATEDFYHRTWNQMRTTLLERGDEKLADTTVEFRPQENSSQAETGMDAWASHIPIEKFHGDPDPVPIMISEYGSNEKRPRVFDEVRQLYGENLDSPLLKTLSGGFVNEFAGFNPGFALVGYRSDGSLELLPDFAPFRDQMLVAFGRSDSSTLKPMD